MTYLNTVCFTGCQIQALSPPQRPLCVVGRLERKKKRARRVRWEGEDRSLLFLLLIVPRALSTFFDYCHFYRDTQREPLRRREIQAETCDTCTIRGKLGGHRVSTRLKRSVPPYCTQLKITHELPTKRHKKAVYRNKKQA